MTTRAPLRALPFAMQSARFNAAGLGACLALAALNLNAQSLRPTAPQTLSPRGVVTTVTSDASVAAPNSASDAATGSASTRSADYIVAVVNSEPLTNGEVRAAVQRLLQRLEQQRRPAPPRNEALRFAMEGLINEKTQLQHGRETGIRIDVAAIDQAEQSVAAQNRVDVAALRKGLQADGVSPEQFRETLRNQLTLNRLRERDVEARVRVTDLEVDQFMREQAASPANGAGTNGAGSLQEINIAQILIAVPDNATSEQSASLQAKAQDALTRVRAGGDFAALARELSDAGDRANGGQLGLRPVDRYPSLFVDALQGLDEGAVTEVLRSGAGFHVLKLVEKRLAGMTVTQSHARHILLNPSAQLNETQARERLQDFKRRIESGQAEFAVLAREASQDGSAAQGGDLGWASPGQFVPEFESVMNALAPGQISDPLISRFGMHLIQLIERRTAALSPREQREVVRNQLREKKAEETFLIWAQDLRGRAYVEFRDPPQ